MTLGFYVDMTSCIGCRTCQVACKDRHDIHEVGPRPRRVDSFECGTYPDVAMFHHVMSCNHCDDPACVKGCPTAALRKDEEGVVVHDDSLCVLCRNCMTVCPYGAPQLDELAQKIVKCDTCKDLRAAGKSPVCVAACPMRAIDFGDVEELRAKYGDDLVDELPYLPTASWTHPNVLYKASDAAKRDDFVAVRL